MPKQHTNSQPQDTPGVQPQPQKPEVNDASASSPTPQEEMSPQQVIEQLQEQLCQAQLKEQRAMADYHNLVRRTQEERAKIIKLAVKDFVQDLLQPLGHLTLASQQLNDPGLTMVVEQLWQALQQHGLQEIEALGQPFDVHTMEVVDRQGDADVVSSVVTRGYTLNGEVIQHAKVVVGGE